MKSIFILWIINLVKSNPTLSCGPVKDGFIQSRNRFQEDFEEKTGINVHIQQSGNTQQIILSGEYRGLQISAVDTSVGKTVGKFQIHPSHQHKFRLLKCQSSRDSVRHSSERSKKSGESRFYWSGQCTSNVRFMIYTSPGMEIGEWSTAQDSLDWDALELECINTSNSVTQATIIENDHQPMPMMKSAGIGTKILPKSPRKYQPRARTPDANWGSWSEWSQCEGNCEYTVSGTRKRERACLKAGRKTRDNDCYDNGSGNSVEIENCGADERICPEWSSWGKWSSCTKTCDSGTRYKVRYCVLGGPDDCEGPANIEEECNTQPCDIEKKECKDNYSFCPDWQKANYCEEVYTTWMATNCRLSCGKCERKIPNAECKDAYDQSCWRWTRDDKCNDRESKIRSFVREKCMKSCKLCGN